MQYAYAIDFIAPSVSGRQFSDWMNAEPFTAMDAAHDWFCIDGRAEDEDGSPFDGEYACTVYAREDEDAVPHVVDACTFRGHVCDYSTPDWVERIR